MEESKASVSFINIEGTMKIKRKIYFFTKRLFDILCSIIGFIFLLPLMFVVKILYVCSGDFNKIIYIHERVGLHEKKFKMYKFRTMVSNSQEILEEMLKDKDYKKEWDKYHKFENDPRITKIGKILRNTSLDELPQLINILKGDMSIVGPRPMVEEEVKSYKKEKIKFLSVRPGLTGWWACNGRCRRTFKERKKLELYYVDNCSFCLDILILLKTVIVVLKKDGAR